MGHISSALIADAVARVIGTKLVFIDLRTVQKVQPIQIAVFAPASAAAEGGITANEAFDFISAKEVGDEFGYKSPAYRVARMLRPETGGGVSTIRTVIFPIIPTAATQASDVLAINIAGVNPTKNVNANINASGRLIPFSILKTDTVTTLADRIKDTLDAAIRVNTVDSVVEAAVGNDIDITMTVGWNGLSGNGVTIEIEADDLAGVIFTNPNFAGGAGTFDVTTALANFGDTWFNLVINACDPAETVLDQFENFNGTPEDGTGRWAAVTMLPFIALYGTLDSDKDSVTAVPDTRDLDLTNYKVPAPGSQGFDFEAAGAYATRMALTTSGNPPLAYSGLSLLDMPGPKELGDVGDFNNFEGRDFIEKRGVSTAILKGGIYYIEDVNSHYHPDGVDLSAAPYFRGVHVFGRAFNVIFTYKLLVETSLINKVLVSDVKKTTNPEAIDPDKWASIVRAYIDEKEVEAITTDAATSRATVATGISQGNPERVETSFQLIFSNNVRQADNTILFGFNFG
jgi:hypothetical protein